MGAPEATVIVIAEAPFPGAAMVLGLKATFTPGGIPVADSAIELLKLRLMAVVTVELPWPPCATLSELGDAERVKLPVPPVVTLRLVTALCCTPPPLPVTVIA